MSNQQYSYNANVEPLSQNEMEKEVVNAAKRRYNNAARRYLPSVNINGSQAKRVEDSRKEYERKLKNYEEYLQSKKGGIRRTRKAKKTRSARRFRKSRRV